MTVEFKQCLKNFFAKVMTNCTSVNNNILTLIKYVNKEQTSLQKQHDTILSVARFLIWLIKFLSNSLIKPLIHLVQLHENPYSQSFPVPLMHAWIFSKHSSLLLQSKITLPSLNCKATSSPRSECECVWLTVSV